MHAEIMPLDGKYYGTGIKITDPNWDSDAYFEIWVTGNYEPSERELEGYEFRDGKWVRWEPEDTYQGVTYPGEWYEYEISDSHYETETSLKLAQLFVNAVNNSEE